MYFPSESVLIGRFVRALRKHHRLDQITMAKKLEISQSQISKIEKFKAKCELHTWMLFIQTFGIEYNSIATGNINLIGSEGPELKNRIQGNYSIDPRYTQDMGLTARYCLPLINILFSSLDFFEAEQALIEMGVDPDYFIIQSNPINALFLQDLSSLLVRKKLFKFSSPEKYINDDNFNNSYSESIQKSSLFKTDDQFLDYYSDQCNQFFQIDYRYQYNGNNRIQVIKENHLKNFQLDQKYEEMVEKLSEFKLNKMLSLRNKTRYQKLFHATPILGNETGWELRMA